MELYLFLRHHNPSDLPFSVYTSSSPLWGKKLVIVQVKFFSSRKGRKLLLFSVILLLPPNKFFDEQKWIFLVRGANRFLHRRRPFQATQGSKAVCSDNRLHWWQVLQVNYSFFQDPIQSQCQIERETNRHTCFLGDTLSDDSSFPFRPSRRCLCTSWCGDCNHS